jgi:hypothetical protein
MNLSKILIQNIDGRIEALHLEEQFINDYKVFHGEKPIGNQ